MRIRNRRLDPAAPDGELSTVVVTFASVVAGLPALTAAERALLAEWVARVLAHLRTA